MYNKGIVLRTCIFGRQEMRLIGDFITALFVAIGGVGVLILANNCYPFIDDPVLRQGDRIIIPIVFIVMGTISFLLWRQFQRGIGEPSSQDSIWTRIARAMQENW